MPCQDCQPNLTHTISQQTSNLTLFENTDSGCKCCAKQDLVEPVKYYCTHTASGYKYCRPQPSGPSGPWPGPEGNCQCCICICYCSCSCSPSSCNENKPLQPSAAQEAASCQCCVAKKDEKEVRFDRAEGERIRKEEESRAKKQAEATKACAHCGCNKCA